MRKKLRSIIEDNTTKYGKIFDYFIQILIVISLISFSVETLPNKSETTNSILTIIEIVCVSIFSVEYLLRIFVSKKPLKYIFSFYGIIDLLAILPFYIYTAIDLRPIRTFRIFRIFRALKIIRYNRALHRFKMAAGIVKEEVILFSLISGILIFLSAAGIYYFENAAQPKIFASIFHSLWWAIVTLTTVGYGDAYPITVGGKVFTFFVLIIGVAIVTIPAGLAASALSKARTIEDKERENKLSKNKDKSVKSNNS
jgi:voltage-gated potassium channel